jgi:hypothetical protein
MIIARNGVLDFNLAPRRHFYSVKEKELCSRVELEANGERTEPRPRVIDLNTAKTLDQFTPEEIAAAARYAHERGDVDHDNTTCRPTAMATIRIRPILPRRGGWLLKSPPIWPWCFSNCFVQADHGCSQQSCPTDRSRRYGGFEHTPVKRPFRVKSCGRHATAP